MIFLLKKKQKCKKQKLRKLNLTKLFFIFKPIKTKTEHPIVVEKETLKPIIIKGLQPITVENSKKNYI